MFMNGKQGGDAATVVDAESALAGSVRLRNDVVATRSVREGVWMLVTATLVAVMIACLLGARDLVALVWLETVVVVASFVVGAQRRAAVTVRPRGFRGLYLAACLWLELVFAVFLCWFKVADSSLVVGLWSLPITLAAVGPYAALGVWLIVRGSRR